jgi:hypothetical protein
MTQYDCQLLCEKYVVRPTCGPVGGANFGHGAKTPGRDEARDEAKASRRSNFDEGPRSTMRRSTPVLHDGEG